ncbi:MAG: cysteine desulfurase family protein [Flavobacteriaceae bacterium]
MDHIYLDNAATTCVRKEVSDKMASVLRSNYGNPSSTHSFGRSSKSILEKCRKNIASFFNVKPSEIIFTSGGTEADNLVLRSAVLDLKINHIITSKIEHHAVGHTVNYLKDNFNVKISYVRVFPDGKIDYNHLDEILSKNNLKALVTLMHINNEIGTILDLNRVSKICKLHGALFHSDTVQSIGHYSLDLSKINIDFLAASAHKFHGPKGIGFAFIRNGIGIKSIITGGSQERGFRSGTESLHDIVGLNESLKISYERLEIEKAHISEIKSYFINKLNQEIPGVKFNGSSNNLKDSTYTLVSVCFPVDIKKSPLFLFQLDLNGIACSKGSACQSGSDSGSHVLNEILTDDDLKKPSIRFSFSCFNTKNEIDLLVKVLKDIIFETS